MVPPDPPFKAYEAVNALNELNEYDPDLENEAVVEKLEEIELVAHEDVIGYVDDVAIVVPPPLDGAHDAEVATDTVTG